MEEKYAIALIIIGCMTVLQISAWIIGANGQVFAFTSLIIGGIAGSLFGFSLSSKVSKK